MQKAVILWSGGIDSTGLILWALSEGFEVFPLFLNRHQSNYKWEKRAIEALYSEILIKYPNLKLNNFREYEIITPASELKKEFSKTKFKFVYFIRNSDLLNNAVRLALCLGARTILIGSVIEDINDSTDFPDNHPNYLKAKKYEINMALEIMCEEKIEIKAPFIEKKWDKTKIIDFLKEYFEKLNLKLTRSCYHDSKIPCGKCRACKIRKNLKL